LPIDSVWQFLYRFLIDFCLKFVIPVNFTLQQTVLKIHKYSDGTVLFIVLSILMQDQL